MLDDMAFHLGVICGGPSCERGISLNSARSLLDHLQDDTLTIHPLYVDRELRFYRLSSAQLYSNTPSDFDFKLYETAEHLEGKALEAVLKNIDLVFPAIHGSFGETGELQALLEKMNIPFVGSGSEACKKLFFKHCAAETLMRKGFGTLPAALLEAENFDNAAVIQRFFRTHQPKRAIIKPSAGGSSIGVHSINTPDEALQKANLLFNSGIDTRALLEPFVEGNEFTVLVFQNPKGSPYALIPTEIDVSYEEHGLFDYRRKYLPTTNTRYHTPPRFSNATTTLIQQEAEAIFTLFGMRDFGRIDGWSLPGGKLLFTDINPISGMEQNSFVFRQSSLVGLNHRQTLLTIIESACRRYGIKPPATSTVTSRNKRPVYVLFGGSTAERQVSLMSGTNIWLKLLKSTRYTPQPFFWAQNETIWPIPYSYALNHTAEEVMENCEQAAIIRPQLESMIHQVHLNAAGALPPYTSENLPQPLTLDAFLTQAQIEEAFVFIGLHGGAGENGQLQTKLAAYNLPYNGPNAPAASLCMDKYATGLAIQKAAIPGLTSLPKQSYPLSALIENAATLWPKLIQELASQTLILKPRHDGCSAGIIKLTNQTDLNAYIKLAAKKAPFIPPHTFFGQTQPIEMPPNTDTDYLFEPYIEPDTIQIKEHSIIQTIKQGWVEITVGVLEAAGEYHALFPSITIAEGAVLSLEEKFQGGTGINLTPPPHELITEESVIRIRTLIESAAKALGITNYARLDAFYNRKTQELVLIEANTLPGLTPSTVIYHQALAETPPLSPHSFLEHLIDSAWAEHTKITPST